MERRRQSVNGIDEVDRQHCLDVTATLRTRTTSSSATTEHLPEDVAHCIPTEISWVEAKTSAGSSKRLRPRTTNFVVFLASLFVTQDVVGAGDFLEAFFCCGVVGIGVWMELTSEFAVRLGDFLLRSGRRYAKDCVIVLFEPLPLHGQP